MIDNFALGLTHGLMILAAWRLLSRPDLEDDDAARAPGPGLWSFARARRKEQDGA